MIRLALLVVPLLLSFSPPLSAQITDPKATFTAMCVAEKSTGFSWRKGNWEYTRFKEHKYIVEKLELEATLPSRDGKVPRSGLCKEEMESGGKDSRYWERNGLSYGCYNWREFGDEFDFVDSRVCVERWSGKGTDRALQRVFCGRGATSWEVFTNAEQIAFTPDGWFHRSAIHSTLENNPKNDYKDSLAIQVGRCAVISK